MWIERRCLDQVVEPLRFSRRSWPASRTVIGVTAEILARRTRRDSASPTKGISSTSGVRTCVRSPWPLPRSRRCGVYRMWSLLAVRQGKPGVRHADETRGACLGPGRASPTVAPLSDSPRTALSGQRKVARIRPISIGNGRFDTRYRTRTLTARPAARGPRGPSARRREIAGNDRGTLGTLTQFCDNPP